MDMQNVSSLQIPEGQVRTIHNKDKMLLWGKVNYNVKYSGDSLQQNYTGKNLLPFPYDETHATWYGIVFAVGPDGTVVVNGKNNNGGNSHRFLFFNSASPLLLSAGRYYFIPPDSTSVGFVMHKTGGGYIDFNANNNYSVNFSSDTSIDQVYIQVRKGDTTVFNGLTVYPMLSTLSGQTKDDYEMYDGGVVSPSPDHPQNVATVTGNQSIVVTGKNMFNQNMVIENSYFEKDDVTPVIKTSGNNNITVYVPCEPDTYYSFRFPIASSNPPLGIIDVGWATELPTIGTKVYFPKRVYETTTRVPFYNGYKSGSLAKYLVFRFQGSSFMTTGGGWELVKTSFQIEKGATYTPYESPQNHTYQISLGSIELRKIGNYQDYIYKSGGDWYVHRETDKSVYSSSTGWNLGGAYGGYQGFYAGQYTMVVGRDTPIYTNYFKQVPYAAASQTPPTEECFMINATASNNTMIFFSKIITSLSELNDYFSATPMSFYFPLKTPVDTQITDATLISQLNAVHEWLTRYGYSSTVSGDLSIIIDKTSL